MIKFRLTCDQEHDFESWFSSNGDFDRLDAQGLLSCAVCGSSQVKKALMAPRVVTTEEEAKPLSQPMSPAEQAVRALRQKVEAEAEDVGRNFAAEARKIHEGESPDRAIYGEARHDEAKALIEDGVPVAPLPWRSEPRN